MVCVLLRGSGNSRSSQEPWNLLPAMCVKLVDFYFGKRGFPSQAVFTFCWLQTVLLSDWRCGELILKITPLFDLIIHLK